LSTGSSPPLCFTWQFHFFLYVTNLTAVWQAIYCVLALAVALNRGEDKRLYKAAWVLRTVQGQSSERSPQITATCSLGVRVADAVHPPPVYAVPAALLVTLLYWFLVFEVSTPRPRRRTHTREAHTVTRLVFPLMCLTP
jgi:hypothetical protein